MRLLVALPARNEAGRIGAAVRALTAQQALDGSALPAGLFGVLVLVNNSADGTAGAARLAADAAGDGRVPVWVQEVTLPPEDAHVGGARRLALERAAALLETHSAGRAGERGRAVLATTDADTLVDRRWVAATLAALDVGGAAGVGAVAGRILTLPAERAALPPDVRALHLRDTLYRLLCSELGSLLDPEAHDPWPRHHQHFGASLAVCLAAYRRVGGLPRRRCLEDVALVEALARADVPVRHSPQVRVWTSARTAGRVEVGLSSQLGEWARLARSGGTWTVPGAAEVSADALARRSLRAAWRGERAPTLAADWLTPEPELRAALRHETFGLALEEVRAARTRAGLWSGRHAPQPLGEALLGLRAQVASARSSSASRY